MLDQDVRGFIFPNSIIDELLPELSHSELKCYLCVLRKTKGWNKEEDAISVSQFMKVTGLSNKAVISACESLVEREILERKSGDRNTGIYSIKTYKTTTSEKSSLVKNFPATSEKSSPVTSEKSSHTINNIKNNIQNTNKKNTKKSALDLLADFGITGQLADDFMIHRKACKAPITETALKGFQREADKAGIPLAEAITISIERNWRGFKSEWDWRGNGVAQRQTQKMTFAEKNAQPWNRPEDWEGVF
ncbi:replication protein [uncultured Haemophilus sp.]|uniref:replication protein n=1 Tax=uncultured Haemophilus sp. TaxID=237779 RepID=UPI0025FA96FA|nr:replication protein [uncultured Haemophilus sp.]